MKIFKIQIENYRLLRNFSIDLEEELSLVVGKNNTGKTSLLSALDKFLNEKNKFSFDDFNIEHKKEIKTLVEKPEISSAEDFREVGIKLKVFIKYNEEDNLSNICRVMMDLDLENNVIVLGFAYTLGFQDYQRLREEYAVFEAKESVKKKENDGYISRDIYAYLKQYHSTYFRPNKKSFEYFEEEINEKNYINIEDFDTKKIINFKFISAKRNVTNKEIDKTLSGQASRMYKRTEASDEQNEAVDDFKDQLTKADSHLSKTYKSLFKEIIKKVKDFGGVKVKESEIEIISTLQHRELLEENTTVVYKHDDDNHLPEHYNGLGYMNLISMIFEIEILTHEFKPGKDEKPSDINLLFIEEPEAHTHPQMQYIFIKNIKKLLKEGIKCDDGENRELQYVISTHSSCIVADSDFGDIKYLKKENSNNVIAKNLKDLEREYDATQYQFLKQYLTISRAEIFFADKAILIEGDTERILIPTMMKKVDIEEDRELKEEDKFLPLISQNISIIEVGAYSQIFEKLINFLGIKTLIITDLDTVDDNKKKCKVEDGTGYSNDAIRFFFGNETTLKALKGYKLDEKKFNKIKKTWNPCKDGRLCVMYQTEEDKYNARSFEEAFIHLNKNYISSNKENFKGLKNRDLFDNEAKDAYDLADECINKKTHFAIDILFHSNENLSNWKIPAYIKDGLLWLKED